MLSAVERQRSKTRHEEKRKARRRRVYWADRAKGKHGPMRKGAP